MAPSFANENIPPRRAKDTEKSQDKALRRPLANLPLNRYIAHAAPLFHQDHQLKPLKCVSRISQLHVTAQQPLYSQSFSPASFHPQDPVQSPCCTKQHEPIACHTAPGSSTAQAHVTTPRSARPVRDSPLLPTLDAYEGSTSPEEISPLLQQGHSMHPENKSSTSNCSQYELHTLKLGCSTRPLQTAPLPSPVTTSNASQTISIPSPGDSALTACHYCPCSPHSQDVQTLVTPHHRIFSNPFFRSTRPPPLLGTSAPSHSMHGEHAHAGESQTGVSVSVATQTEASLEEHLCTESSITLFSQHTQRSVRMEMMPQALHTPVRVLKKPVRGFSPLRPRSGAAACSAGSGCGLGGCELTPPESPLLRQQRSRCIVRTPSAGFSMRRPPVDTASSSPDAMSSDCGSDCSGLQTPHLAGCPVATVSRQDRELHDSTSSLPCSLPEARSETPLSAAPLKQAAASGGSGAGRGGGVAFIFGTRGKLRITK